MDFSKYSWSVTSPPTAEPITLTEAKLHLRVDGTADDTLITQFIKTARQYCEEFAGRALMATTYQLKMNDWFSDYIELPNPPLWSVDSITYVDASSVTQTLSTSVYAIDKISSVGKVYLDYNQVWPATRGYHHDITINYNAGYSTNFTADYTTNVFTCAGRTFANGNSVRLRNADGALPASLAEATDYYIRDVSGSTFKLAASSGGSAIDISDAGTGTHYIGIVPDTFIAAMKLVIGHLYEHRESATETALNETPMAVKSLLSLDRVINI